MLVWILILTRKIYFLADNVPPWEHADCGLGIACNQSYVDHQGDDFSAVPKRK